MTLELPIVEWRRVSPKYLWVDLIGNVIGTIVALVVTSIPAFVSGIQWFWALPASLAIVLIITLAFTPRRVRAIGYQLRDDDLVFRRGIMFQRIVSVPYGRMQLVDVTAGPLDRAAGLTVVRMHTASPSSNAHVPGLTPEVAQRLRERLTERGEAQAAGL